MASNSGELPFLVAGAGIGGLSAAIALARSGLPTVVFEKSESFSTHGAGIQLGPNATRILRDWGVLKHLGKRAVVSRGILIGDGLTGSPLNTVPFGAEAEERFGAPFLLVHRSDLHAALLKTAQASKSVTLKAGCGLDGFKQGPEAELQVRAEGEFISGKGLICADGVWSALRELVDPGARLQDTRRTAWRTLVDAKSVPDAIREPWTRLWLSPGAHLVHYPVSGGDRINVVSVIDDRRSQVAEGWNRAADPSILETVFEPWNAHVAELVRQGHHWRCWSLYSMSPLRSWTQGRVCLLGDAAHPTVPFLAQGAAMAIEDAAMLAPLLAAAGDEDVAGAMKRYEIDRIERTARTAFESRKMGNIYHMGGIGRHMRNLILRMRKPQSLLKRYDWLYGFRAELG